jgi:hypothetical protein
MTSFAILTFSLNSLCAESWGEKITLSSPSTIESAISSLSSKKENEILVKAIVKKVCEKKGCWMTLKSSNKDIRVTFKNYDFFVPLKLQNKEVLVQGKITEHTMNVKEAKHYAEDAGSKSDHITKPVKEYRIVASGISL